MPLAFLPNDLDEEANNKLAIIFSGSANSSFGSGRRLAGSGEAVDAIASRIGATRAATRGAAPHRATTGTVAATAEAIIAPVIIVAIIVITVAIAGMAV